MVSEYTKLGPQQGDPQDIDGQGPKFSLKTHQVAKIFGVNSETVLTWVRDGKIPPPKLKDESNNYGLWSSDEVFQISQWRYPGSAVALPRSDFRRRVGNKIPVVTVQNQKGGVGKTTTVFNLIAPISENGWRALILDYDNQRNTTKRIWGKETPYHMESLSETLRLIREEEEELRKSYSSHPTILDFYTKSGIRLQDLVRPTRFPLIDYIPGAASIWEADELIKNSFAMQYQLRHEIESLGQYYDIVLIDCPANVVRSMTLWSVNIASSGTIIPVIPSDLAWDAVKELRRSIEDLKKTVNPEFTIYGYLINQYRGNAAYPKTFWEEFRKETQAVAFTSVIKESVVFEEAMHKAIPMGFYQRRGEHADAYREIFRDLVAAHVRTFAPRAAPAEAS